MSLISAISRVDARSLTYFRVTLCFFTFYDIVCRLWNLELHHTSNALFDNELNDNPAPSLIAAPIDWIHSIWFYRSNHLIAPLFLLSLHFFGCLNLIIGYHCTLSCIFFNK